MVAARWAIAALAVAAAPQAARADLAVHEVRIVGRAAPRAPWRDGPTEARLDGRPELMVVGVARERGRRVYLVDPIAERVELGGRAVRAEERRPWPAEVAARWSLVEPHAFRQPDRPSPVGTATAWHSNVSTEPRDFGRWLGYDEITYFETRLPGKARGPASRRRAALVRPSNREEDVHGGLGTIRYKVEVTLPGGQVLATPGARAVDRYGILPSVHRVSVRRDDTILGHLTGYFLVPEVFGSAGPGRNHQTERFVGADCADVLTGAVRRAGYQKVWHTSASALGRYARVVAGPAVLDASGRPDRPIRGVAAGDIVRIDYGGSLTGATPRSWDHVGLLWRDRGDPDGPARGGPDGALDGFDLVVHMGHPRLEVEPLSEQSPARVDVLRWDSRRLGAPVRTVPSRARHRIKPDDPVGPRRPAR